MLIGLIIAAIVWSLFFILCVTYAVKHRKDINPWMQLTTLFGLLSCGLFYGAIYDLIKWVIS